jgi:hypothetical protein
MLADYHAVTRVYNLQPESLDLAAELSSVQDPVSLFVILLLCRTACDSDNIVVCFTGCGVLFRGH